jgi:sugar/nucleoside kinase (ribokinase family)
MDVVLPGRDDYWSIFAEVLPEVDVFLPNTDEARVITGLTDPVAQAEKFRAAGAKTVAITCGEHGTVMLSDELRVRSGIYPVPYVGGTGSGDAFDAGFIAGMIAGEDMLGCLRWGSALGASCVRSVSATDGVFRRNEALEFMRSQELTIQHI